MKRGAKEEGFKWESKGEREKEGGIWNAMLKKREERDWRFDEKEIQGIKFAVAWEGERGGDSILGPFQPIFDSSWSKIKVRCVEKSSWEK